MVSSRKSFTDAIETKFILNDSIIKEPLSTLFDKIYHVYCHCDHFLLGKEVVFWQQFQQFQNFFA